MLRKNSDGFRWVAAVMLAFPLFALPTVLEGQVTGTMSGYVTDPSGAAVPQARVTATLVQQNAIRTAESNAEGFYNFPALLPGVYNLTVEKQGFERLVQTDVTLTVNQNVRLDLKLKLGTVAEAVTVTGQAPLVDTRSPTISGLVDDRRIVDLPLNGRNVIGLAVTVPGILNVNAPQNLDDARSGPTMNVNGGRDNMNLFTFNGAYFNNPSRNTGMNYPPPDAVQEFRVQTANFSSDYGRNPGSQVSVVSKAGTNEFHGSLFEFVRNDKLNARNFFSPDVPGLKQNQFGFAAGGPIRRDKLFIFGSYQGLRDRPQAVPNEIFVPSAAHRSGDFTDLLPPPGNPTAGTVLVPPVDTLTGQPFTDSSGKSCVTNNLINTNCISPAALKFLPFIPQSSTGTVVSLGANPINDDMYMARVDLNKSSKHSIFGHVYVDHNSNTSPFTGCNGDVAGYVGSDAVQETDMITLNDTYAFSPSWVNQFIVSYLRTTSRHHMTKTIPPSQFGINMPTYQPEGAVNINVGSLFSLGSGDPDHFLNNNYEFRDVVSRAKGRHNMRFGGELLRLHFIQRFIGAPSFTFDGTRSGDPVADFLLGAFSSFGMAFGVRDNDDVQNAPSFFFQDDFKVTPRLTLTYGVRYEPYFFWRDSHNRIDTVVPGRQSVKVPDAPVGVVFPGDPGIPQSLVPADKNNFAPRVGFAWDIFGDGKTSMRGAYGVFYESINADSLAQENPPFAGNTATYTGRLDDPFGSTGNVPPPVAPTGSFGCKKVSTFPGYNCPLFPLPVGGLFTGLSLRTPYIQVWNLTIQRQLTPNVLLEASYIGKIGTKIEALRTYNPAKFIPGTVFDASSGIENARSNLDNANNRAIFEPGILSPTGFLLGNDFRSWYHSFQTQVTKRFSQGLSVTASYTLSKSIDSSSTDNLGACVSDPFNLHTERGRSSWDRRHAFVASWVWSPASKFRLRWQNALLGGWTFTGITSLQSGTPLTFLTGTDTAVDGTQGTCSYHAFINDQPIKRIHTSRADMVNEFFNTAAFIDPTCTFVSSQTIEQQNCTPFGIRYSYLGRYGNAGRSILGGPALSTTDFAILKDFVFKERYKVQFRSELFNLFNQVNFNSVDVTVIDGPGAFGVIRAANDGRVVQFALKVYW